MSTVQAVVLCCGRGIACGSSVAWPVALHGQRGAQQLHTIARGLVTAARKFSALGASTSQVPNSIRPLLSQLSGARNVAAAASALPVARTSRAVMEMAVRKGRKVNVILLEQIDSLGHAGAEVSVAPGFARNFLVPFRKAVYATTANRAVHKIVLPPEEQRRVAQEREVNMLRARVAAFRLRLTRATNDGVNLYGSVTAADIVESLQNSPFRKLGVREKGVRFPGQESPKTASDGELPAKTTEPTTDEETVRALKVVGDHVVEIEVRPDLWCAFKLTVSST